MYPGEIFTDDGEHVLNMGRRALTMVVQNTGDRPIQVGPHYPFAETNAALRIDRGAARGMRLNITYGTAVRFEPELFNRGSAHTSFRANFERGYVKANQPRVLPPGDFVTAFFDSNGVNKTAVDPYFAWVAGLVPRDSNPPFAGESRD